MDNLENRLSGALAELVEIAAAEPPMKDAPFTSPAGPRRSRGPMLAAAAVLAIVGMGASLPWIVGSRGHEGSMFAEEGPASDPSTPIRSADPTATSSLNNEELQRAREVAEQLASLWKRPGFGKVVIDEASASITVFWKGIPPPEIDAATERDVQVTVRASRFSEADVEQAAIRLRRAPARDIDGAEIATVSANADLSGATVEVVKPWHGSSATLQAVLGMPVSVVLIDEDDAPKVLTEGR